MKIYMPARKQIFAFAGQRDIIILYDFLLMGGIANMDVQVGDTIVTTKAHPCGASSFEVLRVGMDFKIRCTGCGREVMIPRAKIEKNIKKILRAE